MDLEESARLAEEIKEKAHLDSITAINHVSSPVDENMHMDLIPSPIRRKSLYMPGIATRIPNDILRKPPPPDRLQTQADRDYYFNPNLPESSPLARLAALEMREADRAASPNLNYSHLGGLKLGTLRVTNGSTSSASQDLVPHRSQSFKTKSSKSEENGWLETGSERNQIDVDAADPIPNKILPGVETFQEPISLSSQTQTLQQAVSADGEGGHHSLRKGVETNDSPRTFEHLEGSGEIKERESGGAYSKWLHRKDSLPPGFFPTISNQVMEPAHDQKQDFSDSPLFCVETLTHDSSKAASKSIVDEFDKLSLEDEGLFISKTYRSTLEMWRSSIHVAEAQRAATGSREDALRKLNSNSVAQPKPVTRPTSSSTTSKMDHRGSTCSEPSTAKSIPKLDSGYSSSESLELAGTNATESCDSSEISIPADTRSLHLRASQPLSDPRDRPRNPKDDSRTGRIMLMNMENPDVPLVSVDPWTEPKMPIIRNQNDIPTEDSISSPTDIHPPPRSKSRLGKLRKARRSSQPLPVSLSTIQSTRELSQSHIPPVPAEIAGKHAARLDQFPLLEHTFPSLEHVKSNESLLSEEPICVPIRFPSPTSSLERATSICNLNLDWSTRISPKSKEAKSDRGRTTALKSRKGRRSSQGELPTAIADFGTVADSLGGSPYDVARSASANPWKDSNVSNHDRTSTALTRAKSMITADQATFAGTAKVRKTRSIQSFSQPFPIRKGMLEGPGGIRGKLMRPHSMHENVPPVPALPAQYPVESRTHEFSQFPKLPRANPNHGDSISRKAGQSQNMSATASPSSTQEHVEQKANKFSWHADSPHQNHSDRRKMIGRIVRPRSTIDDVPPPMPDLPTKSRIEQIEAQISRSNSARTNVLPLPLKSLEKPCVGRNVNMIDEAKISASTGNWESHRQAWSQRRKSAGDALLLQSQTTEFSKPFPSGSPHADYFNFKEQVSCSPASPTDSRGGIGLTANARPTSRPVAQIQVSSPSLPTSTAPISTSQIPRKRVAAATAALETLSGRFTGGLSYGYEPGYGLGGSAGTRNIKTAASRKSVGVSRGYGLDLSDVPIFVTPVPQQNHA